MSTPGQFPEEPGAYDFLDLMRRLEHLSGTKPRIGESGSSAEAVTALGQRPHIDFADSNVSRIDTRADGTFEIESRFLGMLGLFIGQVNCFAVPPPCILGGVEARLF